MGVVISRLGGTAETGRRGSWSLGGVPWVRWRTPSRLDLLVGAALVVYAAALSLGEPRLRDAVDLVLLAGVAVAVVVRRSAPELVLGVCLLARTVQVTTERIETYPTWAVSIALFTVVAARPIWLGLLAAAATVTAFLATFGTIPITVPLIGSTLGFFAPSYAAGMAVRRLGLLNEKLARAADDLAASAAEREEAAVAQERSRLRDDLHDIVGHHVNVAAVLADTARAAHGRDERRLLHALDVIGDSCRTALLQMERATAWLGESAELEPTPSFEQRSLLFESMRSAGLDVRETVAGDPGALLSLDAVRSATAFRVLREALTNVLKHSPGRWSHVEVTPTTAELRVAVRSAPVSGASDERGLRRLRRRVELVGGRLEVESTDDAFVQTLSLPTGTAR